MMKALVVLCAIAICGCGTRVSDGSDSLVTERGSIPSRTRADNAPPTSLIAVTTTSSPETPTVEQTGCRWELAQTFNGGAMGNEATIVELQNSGDAPCPPPGLASVEGHEVDGATLTANLGDTYFPLDDLSTDIAPNTIVRIVIATTNVPCGSVAGIDGLSIALTDGATFDIPLESPIDPSCEFAADIGVA